MSFLIIAPLIFSIFIFRRKPLLCLRNVAVAGVLFPLVAGTILFPYSLQFDVLNISNHALFEASTKKAMTIITLGISSFILSILIFDTIFTRSNKNISFPAKIIQLIEQFKNISHLKSFIIFAIITILGAIPLFTVFLKLDFIPFCNISDISDKYFTGLTDLYIPFRPFYTLGQHILAVTGFVILLYIFSIKSFKRTSLFTLLYITTFLCLLLTAKRGELLYPFVMLIGSLILLNKIKQSDIFKIALVAFIAVCLILILDPSYKRLFTQKMCSGIYSVLEIDSASFEYSAYPESYKVFSVKRWLKVLVDTFGIQVRETARLLYHFSDKGENFYYGKTFLAGTLGFIPTTLFSFKEKNYFGRVTQRLFGNNPETAGGPNIGLIGESYINFWYIGVIVMPFFIGILVWFLDRLHFDILQNNSSYGIITASIFFFLLYHLIFMTFQIGSTAMQAFTVRSIIIGAIGFFSFYNIK
jgi:hypothetical protein